MHIDPGSSEPIFLQVAFQIKRDVVRGELRAGDRLPSVRDLARQLAVNPNTIIRSYDQLENDGVIVRRQGAGCFVTGHSSALEDGERQRRLDAMVRRAVVEAKHLGFSRARVQRAVDAAFDQLDERQERATP